MYESFKQAISSARASASGALTAEVAIYQDVIAPAADYLFNQPHSIAGATSSVLGAGAWGVGKVVQASNYSRLFNMTMATIALGSVVKQALGASGGQLWKPLGKEDLATKGYTTVGKVRNTWRSWSKIEFKKPEVTTALSKVWENGRGNFKMKNLPLLSGVATGISFIAVAATQFTNMSEGYKTLVLASLAVSYFASDIMGGIKWLSTLKAAAPTTEAERKLNELLDALSMPENERADPSAARILHLASRYDVNVHLVHLLKPFLGIKDENDLPIGNDLVEAFDAKLKESSEAFLVDALKHVATSSIENAQENTKGRGKEGVELAINKAWKTAEQICGAFGYNARYDKENSKVTIEANKY